MLINMHLLLAQTHIVADNLNLFNFPDSSKKESLSDSAHFLNEVVITAMNIPREKKTIGYASQEIESENLTHTQLTDLNNALAGKISGARYWGASGATFDEGKIILRGTASLTNARGKEPIYIVDGVITDVKAVNMDIIESVNVLKGSTATALYGSRGGNGAVIITTKKGKQEKGQFEFGQSCLWEKVSMRSIYQSEYGGGSLGAESELLEFNYNPAIHPAYLQAMDGVRYYDMESSVSWGPRFNGQLYAPWYAWDPTHPKFGQTIPWEGQPGDNLKELYRTGFSNITNLAFSKATDKFRSRIAFSNVSRTGIVENSDAVRRYFSFNADYDVSDRLNVSADYKYTYRKDHNAAVEGYGGLQNAISGWTQWFDRNVDLKDLKTNYTRPDGTFRSYCPISITNLNPHYHDNPYVLMNEIDRINTGQWNLITSTATFDIIKKKLKIGVNVNANLQNCSGDAGEPSLNGEVKVPYNILGQISRYAVNQNSLTDTQIQGFLSFSDSFISDKLDVNAAIYVEQHDFDYRTFSATTTNGLISNHYYNLKASVGTPYVNNTQVKMKERSLFGTGVVGWDGTYYADFSLRNDWSSTLPPDANSYLYGGLSFSVIASNFLKRLEFLDFWKLRASAAQVGSTLEPYNIQETYIINPSENYGEYTGMYMDEKAKNRHIRPTISTSYEVGTEFRLFKNRFYGDVTYYIKDAKDQIIGTNVTPESGYTNAIINAGKIRNQGYEITLGGTPVKMHDFEWNIYLNWAQNKNKLLELNADDPETTSYKLAQWGSATTLYLSAEVGKPIGVIRGSVYEKSLSGEIIYIPQSEGSPMGEAVPLCATKAMEELGNIQPDATGGFGTSFSWKGLSLSFAFDYQIGGQIASTSNRMGERNGLLNSTVGKNDRSGDIRSNVWTNDGGVKVTGVTKQGSGEDAVYTPFSGYMDAQYYFLYKASVYEPYIYDASYLRMQELALSYTLPATLVKKLKVGLSEARVSLMMQNPWLIYSGIPNVDATSIGHSYNNYIELGQTFSTRSMGISFNLMF